MSTEIQDTWTLATDRLWMAGSSVYPRIAVVAATEDEALSLLAERRAWWLDLPDDRTEDP